MLCVQWFGRAGRAVPARYISKNDARRTNVCDRNALVNSGSLSMRDGLAGKNLIIGTGVYADGFITKDDSSGSMTGFEIDVLDELAAVGNFTYDIYLINSSEVSNWSTFLGEYLEHFDMITYTYWVLTPGRALDGAFSPYGIFDLSYIFLMLEKVPESSGFSWEAATQFTNPFDGLLWLALILAALVTSMAYWFIEGWMIENDDDFPSDGCIPQLQAFFLSAMMYTGQGGYAPRTWPGKLLMTSWAWFVVLFISAYTANLATFLVMKGAPEIGYKSLEQAVAGGAKICVSESTAMGDWFEKTFPNYPGKVGDVAGPDGPLKRLRAGGCEGAITTRIDWEMLQDNAELNNYCDMKVVGPPLSNSRGGWMVLNDYTKNCTDLVQEVFHILFLQLQSTGRWRQMYQDFMSDKMFYSRGDPTSCSAPPSPEEASDLNSLKLKVPAMAGVLIVHAVLVVLSLIGSVRVFRNALDVQNFRRGKAPGDAGTQQEEEVTEVRQRPSGGSPDQAEMLRQLRVIQGQLARLGVPPQDWSGPEPPESPPKTKPLVKPDGWSPVSIVPSANVPGKIED